MTAVMDLAAAPLRIASPAQVHSAHHRIRRFAAQVLDADTAYDVGLMACEAMSNAVLHGHGDVTVTVSCTATALRVEVHDDGPALLVVGRVDHGRGLTLIQALAARWALDRAEDGTCMWFEVDREVGL